MLKHQDFAVESLESRLEQFCIYMPFLSTCYKTVWGVTISYPCIKYERICF